MHESKNKLEIHRETAMRNYSAPLKKQIFCSAIQHTAIPGD